MTGRVLTSIQLDDWSAGFVAVESDSIWILQVKEPPSPSLKPYTARLVRVDAATGQVAERIQYEVTEPESLWATDGSLWLLDPNTTRLRHGFTRFELSATS